MNQNLRHSMSKSERTLSKAHQSNSNAIETIRTLYYLVRDSVNGTGGEEDADVRFIYGDGIVTAQIETDWFDFENGNGDQIINRLGEGRCSDGNRSCAFVRAHEHHNHDKAVFHCGCRPET